MKSICNVFGTFYDTCECVYAVTYEIGLGFLPSPKKDDRKNEGAAGRKGLRRGGRRKA